MIATRQNFGPERKADQRTRRNTNNGFWESFVLRLCSTVYKWQGCIISAVSYATLDANRMNKKQLYTALSRDKTQGQIRLDPGTVNYRY